MKKEYIVTLKDRKDLKSFYEDMETFGGTQYVPDREVELKDRREISRNTHYLLTEEEVERLKKDDRVLDIELTPEERGLRIVRRSSYTVSGNFDKSPDSGSDINWGILHCAGNQSQRRKGFFGIDQIDQFNDTVTVFNNGENVDVVIVDEPVAYDHDEFLDPDTGQTRFIQYQWFNELDQYMVDLDTVESDSDWSNFISSNGDSNGEITYYSCSDLNSHFPNLSHGTHVAGIAAGKTQGWARKSNIYSIAVLEFSGIGGDISALRLFDYIRAFHKNKDINSTTGKRNLTVTNHSWGYSYNEISITNLSDITSVNFRGTVYNNPGWTISDLGSNFGIYVTQDLDGYHLNIPAKISSVDADVQDAIEEGVIVISAAGNDNYYGVPVGHQDYDNTVTITGTPIYYNRGGSPGSTLDAINVGNISAYSDFRRAESSNFGPIVNVFAPGSNIISSVPASNTSTYQSKSGTSMASPQVAGIIACFCSGKDDVNNSKALAYIQELGIDEDMNEDLNGGGFDDITTLRDAPNLTAASVERREGFAVISFNDFSRELEGVLYPRKRIGKKFEVLSFNLNATIQKDGNNVSQVDENESITLSLLSSDAPDGTRFYYTIKQDDINIDISDITVDGNPATQNDYFEMSSGSSSKVFSFPQNVNTVIDGSIKLELYLESDKVNRYDLKPECLIKNITEDYLITVTPTTLTEGQSINFTVNETTNLASDGTVVDFELYGFNGSQITSVTSFNNTGDNNKLITYDPVNEKWVGEFNIQSGTDYLQVTTLDDNVVVDSSSVNVYMTLNNSSRGDSTTNAHIKPNITSTSPSYIDTSVPEYIISSNNNVDEDGGILTINISSNIRTNRPPVSFYIIENTDGATGLSANNIQSVSGTGVTWDSGTKIGTYVPSATDGSASITVTLKTDSVYYNNNNFDLTITESGSQFSEDGLNYFPNSISKSISINEDPNTELNYSVSTSSLQTTEGGTAIDLTVTVDNVVGTSIPSREISLTTNGTDDVTLISPLNITSPSEKFSGVISAIDENLVENYESYNVTLTDQYGSFKLNNAGSYVSDNLNIPITILDNDVPQYTLSVRQVMFSDDFSSDISGWTIASQNSYWAKVIYADSYDGTMRFSSGFGYWSYAEVPITLTNSENRINRIRINIPMIWNNNSQMYVQILKDGESLYNTEYRWLRDRDDSITSDLATSKFYITPDNPDRSGYGSSSGYFEIDYTGDVDPNSEYKLRIGHDQIAISSAYAYVFLEDVTITSEIKSLENLAFDVDENGGTVEFNISSNVRDGRLVNFSITENTDAITGLFADNIDSVTGTNVTWNSSNKTGTFIPDTSTGSASITVTLKTDNIIFDGNSFNITFTENGSDFKLDTDTTFQQNFVTKSINVNDETPAVYLITPSAYIISEGGSAINVDVEITNAVNVSGRTINLSSNSPSDVTIPSSLVVATTGPQHIGSFSITPQEDSLVEGTEINTITLSDQVYTTSTFTFDGVNFDIGQTDLDLTLVDNDTVPEYTITTTTSNGNGTIDENGGTVTFSISSNVRDGRAVQFNVNENFSGSIVPDNILSVTGDVNMDSTGKSGTFNPSTTNGSATIIITSKTDNIIWDQNSLWVTFVESGSKFKKNTDTSFSDNSLVSDSISIIDQTAESFQITGVNSMSETTFNTFSVTSNIYDGRFVNFSIQEETIGDFTADNISSVRGENGTILIWNSNNNTGTVEVKPDGTFSIGINTKTDNIYFENDYDFVLSIGSDSKNVTITPQVDTPNISISSSVTISSQESNPNKVDGAWTLIPSKSGGYNSSYSKNTVSETGLIPFKIETNIAAQNHTINYEIVETSGTDSAGDYQADNISYITTYPRVGYCYIYIKSNHDTYPKLGGLEILDTSQNINLLSIDSNGDFSHDSIYEIEIWTRQLDYWGVERWELISRMDSIRQYSTDNEQIILNLLDGDESTFTEFQSTNLIEIKIGFYTDGDRDGASQFDKIRFYNSNINEVECYGIGVVNPITQEFFYWAGDPNIQNRYDYINTRITREIFKTSLPNSPDEWIEVDSHYISKSTLSLDSAGNYKSGSLSISSNCVFDVQLKRDNLLWTGNTFTINFSSSTNLATGNISCEIFDRSTVYYKLSYPSTSAGNEVELSRSDLSYAEVEVEMVLGPNQREINTFSRDFCWTIQLPEDGDGIYDGLTFPAQSGENYIQPIHEELDSERGLMLYYSDIKSLTFNNSLKLRFRVNSNSGPSSRVENGENIQLNLYPFWSNIETSDIKIESISVNDSRSFPDSAEDGYPQDLEIKVEGVLSPYGHEAVLTPVLDSYGQLTNIIINNPGRYQTITSVELYSPSEQLSQITYDFPQKYIISYSTAPYTQEGARWSETNSLTPDHVILSTDGEEAIYNLDSWLNDERMENDIRQIRDYILIDNDKQNGQNYSTVTYPIFYIKP